MARAKLQLRTASAAARVDPDTQAPSVVADKDGKGSASVRPDREGKRLIAGHFPKATWATLRDLGTKLDKTNQELLQEALDDLFAKHRHRGH